MTIIIISSNVQTNGDLGATVYNLLWTVLKMLEVPCSFFCA